MTATKTSTRRTAKADTAPKGLPRDLDQSDVDADAQRMADELAAREAAAAKPAPRRSRKATPAAPAETAPEAAPAPRKARAPKADAPQPQQPAQPVEAAEVPAFTVTAINRGTGNIEIHNAGCRDLKREARGASVWDIEARSVQEIVENCAADFLAEDPATNWKHFREGITLAACCPALPEASGDAQPADKVAQTPKLDQAATITAFLAAHPDEAFTPHQISKATTPEGRKRLGLRDACARLAKADKIAQVSDKPLKYRATPAA